MIRPYEYPDDSHTVIAYEFDSNLYKVEREVYNLLDWLGDLGGLKEAVMIILGFIFGLFNYHTFADYLVSQLYRSETIRDRTRTRLFEESGDIAEDLYLQKHEGKRLKTEKVNCFS